MNVLLIDGKEYRIGAKVKNNNGRIGVITKFDVRSENDSVPLRVDFLGGLNPCGYYGPNDDDPSFHITLVEEDKPDGTQAAVD